MNVLAAAQEGFSPLNPEFGLPFYITIVFLVVLYVLAKKVFPKLDETLADREAKIREDLQEAERTKQEAEQVLDDYKARVSQAREEANKIIDESRQAADSVRTDLLKRAEAEARLIVDKAQKELAGERDRTMGELQSQLATWSTEIASRIVHKELTPEGQSDLVDAFIRDVQSKGV